ncbi:MAG: CHAD domain-containing protein [Chromatiaceae bacterium]|nr:CHAD domain-containing protein [Chromatiaceae bacterium]
MSSIIKSSAPVTPSQNVSKAFATIMAHNYEFIVAWEDKAKNWEDIEGVHQMRVAIRRLRSALSLFRAAIPKEASKPWSEEMRWIVGELGLARDLDVFIDEGLTHAAPHLPLPGAEGLDRVARLRRARAYQEQVEPMLESKRYRQFKEGFHDWYAHRRWEGTVEKQRKPRNLQDSKLVPFARALLDKQERQVLLVGSHVDRNNAAAMHQLRIECKKLRYAAEFFRPLFNGMDSFIAHMKGIQDLLGLMNDVSVTRHVLDTILAEESNHEILVYAGGLIGWRTCDFFHSLGRFDGFWNEFTEARHPWWKSGALIDALELESVAAA